MRENHSPWHSRTTQAEPRRPHDDCQHPDLDAADRGPEEGHYAGKRAPWSPPPARVDNTILKALARAHRWRGMPESKLFGSVPDLAKAEKINEAYLGRVLRLTLLSPTITEAILSGQLADGVDLAKLLKPLPVVWHEQEALFLKRA